MSSTKTEQTKDTKQFIKDTLVGTNSRKKPTKRKTKLHLIMETMRLTFQLLEYTSPKIAGWWAMRLWLSTHRFSEPTREKDWSKSARISKLPHKYGPITLYHWNEQQIDAPRVLLIHGWNGRGLQLAGFVNPLLQLGFQVISFDAPGHGRSPGNQSNLLRIADVATEISKSVGPIDSIIAHSFGAMVMAHIIKDGLKIRKAVAISSPKNADYLIDEFCSVLKIKNSSKENFLHRIDIRFGENILAKISAINNIKNLSIPGLIVHDINDRDIPVEHAQALNDAWPESKILITKNLGHQRILRNEQVINSTVDFITKDN